MTFAAKMLGFVIRDLYWVEIDTGIARKAWNFKVTFLITCLRIWGRWTFFRWMTVELRSLRCSIIFGTLCIQTWNFSHLTDETVEWYFGTNRTSKGKWVLFSNSFDSFRHRPWDTRRYIISCTKVLQSSLIKNDILLFRYAFVNVSCKFLWMRTSFFHILSTILCHRSSRIRKIIQK